MHFCISGVLRGMWSSALPALTDVPTVWKKTVPRKALNEESSASPRACSALVSLLDPG